MEESHSLTSKERSPEKKNNGLRNPPLNTVRKHDQDTQRTHTHTHLDIKRIHQISRRQFLARGGLGAEADGAIAAGKHSPIPRVLSALVVPPQGGLLRQESGPGCSRRLSGNLQRPPPRFSDFVDIFVGERIVEVEGEGKITVGVKREIYTSRSSGNDSGGGGGGVSAAKALYTLAARPGRSQFAEER